MATVEEQIAQIRSQMTPEQREANRRKLNSMVTASSETSNIDQSPSTKPEIATPTSSTMTGRHLKQVDEAVSAAISGDSAVKRKKSTLATPGE